MESVLGVDVAKQSFVVCLLTAEETRSEAFENTKAGFLKLVKWIGRHSSEAPHVCMEATSTYHVPLATWRHKRGYTVSIANPWSVKQFFKAMMRRSKTDRVDAKVIAEYCRCVAPRTWEPRTAERQALLVLVRRRASLADRKAVLANQLSIAEDRVVKASIKREAGFVSGEMRQLDRAILKVIRGHEALNSEYELLLSIPAIGPVSAPAIIAELGDIKRFDSPRQVAAYAGLTPQAHESGESVKKQENLTPLGNRRLKRALYMPGVVAFRTQRLYGSLITRPLWQQREKKTIIAALMRKLLHLAYGVLKSGRPFDPTHQPRRDGPRAMRSGAPPC